jgi:hypothetical protein
VVLIVEARSEDVRTAEVDKTAGIPPPPIELGLEPLILDILMLPTSIVNEFMFVVL